MLFNILAIFAIVVALFLIWVAARPDTFRVERKALVPAPKDKVFALLQDFHQWRFWSPWFQMDPNMHIHYSGAALGLGAVYEWQGNPQIGEGRCEIVDCNPEHKLKIDIAFYKPMVARNTIEFTLSAKDGGTEVTHAMYGKNNFLAKLMGLFLSMDKMVGEKFAEGLHNIEQLVKRH